MSSDIVFEPSTSAVAQITQLSEMSMDEIKSLWRQLYRKEPPTHIRSFLEKRLAYRLQEVEFRRAHQNLAEKNDRRISAIINTGKKPLRDRYPQPIPGTVLSRIYQEKEHKVTVIHDGQFEFEGRIYKSLSVIAREITGTRWSGPLFFGLRKAMYDKKAKRGKK
ncbi:MAG: DUF2924 domain-containing protein [Cellvibrionaceae bacterium]